MHVAVELHRLKREELERVYYVCTAHHPSCPSVLLKIAIRNRHQGCHHWKDRLGLDGLVDSYKVRNRTGSPLIIRSGDGQPVSPPADEVMAQAGQLPGLQLAPVRVLVPTHYLALLSGGGLCASRPRPPPSRLFMPAILIFP